jgi:transcriptional regulator with XRE-family HTH domain
MTLDEYLRSNGLTEPAFAAVVGISQSYVNRLRHGECWPPRDLAERITKATKGVVTANDFMTAGTGGRTTNGKTRTEKAERPKQPPRRPRGTTA